MKQKSFILYHDMWEQLKELTDAERGKILEAIFVYHSTGEIIVMDRILSVVFSSIRTMLDRDREKYDEYIEKQSSNGRKGGRPRNPTDSGAKPENPSVILETHGNPTKAKKADSDSVSANVSVSPSDSDSKVNTVATATQKNNSLDMLIAQSRSLDNNDMIEIPEYAKNYKDEWLRFILYWGETNSKGRTKAELQKTFDIRRRFATWMMNKKDTKVINPITKIGSL